MTRRTLAALLIIVLFVGFCVYGWYRWQAHERELDQATPLVYVTHTGECYHRDGCQYLRYSRIKMYQRQAEKKGYRACSRCGSSAGGSGYGLPY